MVEKDSWTAMARRTLRFRTTFHNTIYDVFKARGWKETDHDQDWDVAWMDTGWIRDNFDHLHMQDHQRVNHFRNHYELTRKDNLIKNVKRTQRQLIREDRATEASKYDFCPITYVLPADYGLFVEEFKLHSGSTWIMKPIGKAQGKGIFLFNKLSQISNWKKDAQYRPPQGRNDAEDVPEKAETYVVQRYVENPLLIGCKKFDLRLYVLVTSYMPVTVYLYRSGFARFSMQRYTLNKKSLDDNCVHLTNVAVQKTGAGYDQAAGCKWPLRNMKLYLIGKYGIQAVDELFYNIQGILINSLLAVQKVMINDKHCFEMYGYDILVDDQLKPWLLEVNASPSLTADTPADYELKFGLLDDVYSVLESELRGDGDLQDTVGGFDLIYHNGEVKLDKHSYYTTRLGCHDESKANKPPPGTRVKSKRREKSAAN